MQTKKIPSLFSWCGLQRVKIKYEYHQFSFSKAFLHLLKTN